MKITLNSFFLLLNKVSYAQLLTGGFISILFYKEHLVFNGLLVSTIASVFYTQLIKLSSISNIFIIYGFPIRLIIIGVPTAILVHKLHSNLIALFVGFLICQIIYFLYIWSYAKEKSL